LVKTPQELIGEFAAAVMAQDQCIIEGDPREGNRHARKSMSAAKKLLAGGEASIEAFCGLLNHPTPGVQAAAAAFLLKARTERAVATLRPMAEGRGLTALGAQMTLARYERGELEIT